MNGTQGVHSIDIVEKYKIMSLEGHNKAKKKN